MAIIYALLMLAVVIALFGIGNTFALSIIERTRELGLLRAVGMTRRQLRTTVRWEAVLTVDLRHGRSAWPSACSSAGRSWRPSRTRA